MNSQPFDWTSQLQTAAPPGSALQGALFTTYDRADERFMVEHLLPVLLKLERDGESEGKEKQYFLVELEKRLAELDQRIVVISSIGREEIDPDSAEYPAYEWIWRRIRHLAVGRERPAVQHAKLWMLHWKYPDETEYLELVVSSSNLTRAAFRGQIQGVWRACLKLHAKGSSKRRARWGLLPAFLGELAASTADGKALTRFVELLARADCPSGTTFVASVPGTHSRENLRHSPWGAAGLAAIAPGGRGDVRMSILCPFVGSWNESGLVKFCKWFESEPRRLSFIWIEKDHPWTKHWLLPEGAHKALVAAGATFLSLRPRAEADEADLFHPEHKSGDERWSHAKVYSLCRGRSQRLLITSANFSPAAWGHETKSGQLTIENFELGVCVEQADWPPGIEPFDDPNDAATVPAPPPRIAALIGWARAIWNGRWVDIECRCEAIQGVVGAIQAGRKTVKVKTWRVAPLSWLRTARVFWPDEVHPPSVAILICGAESLRIPVCDTRPPENKVSSVLPGMSPEDAQRLCDELLFEQYGGRAVDCDLGEEFARTGPTPPDTTQPESSEDRSIDSYAVPAFEDAREHLMVVDNWADRLCALGARSEKRFAVEVLRRDGVLLHAAFERLAARDAANGHAAGRGAALAATELQQRLDCRRED